MVRIGAIITVLLIVAGTVTAEYHIVPIGSLGGTHGKAQDINDSGVIVGYSANVDNIIRPFMWSDTLGLVDLGTLAGGSNTSGRCYGINNNNWCVGRSENADGVWNATLWKPGQLPRDLGDLPGYTQSFAVAINDYGQVIGEARKFEDGDMYRRAFLWSEQTGMLDLGTLGGENSHPNDINNFGIITGLAENPSLAERAFLSTGPDDVDEMYPETYDLLRSPISINDNGVSAGQAENAVGNKVPAIFPADLSEPIFLNVAYGWATDINNDSTVVGRYKLHSYDDSTLPFIWTSNGSITTLPYIEETGHYYVESINEAGVIVGSGTVDGHEVPLIWVPEPACVGVLALGGLALLRRKRA